jgi:glycine/D-amino acid oxidase-like deaminating enzyme
MLRTSRIFHPVFQARPYWWEAWAPSAEPAAELPSKTDVAIVGGGYAGLSAALELARAGTAVTVLEANAFGQGASTRNGGAVSGGVKLARSHPGRNARDGGRAREEQMGALLASAAESLRVIESIIVREKIECVYERTGRFVGAFTSRHYDELARNVELLNRHTDADAAMVPRDAQREHIASDFYFGGMAVRGSGKLHPALYYRGLLEACRRQHVRLCATTRVRRIGRAPGGFAISTGRGTIDASEVVIATNGETGEATPALKRRIIPVASHIIATEELPADLARSLFPTGKTISDTPRVLTYYRMSPDGTRVLFGGRARFTQVRPEVSAPVLYGFMTDRLPQLKGVRITHAWTGNVAFTFDFLPHMGRENGMHYALGCNGSGVAMMTYLGTQTARKILGGTESVCAFDGRGLPVAPWYFGNPWFLPLVWQYYHARDTLDRRFLRSRHGRLPGHTLQDA